MQSAQTKTTYMALAGLFAALAAICSWISIPLGFTPVPLNLATLSVFLAGGILGGRYGAISLSVYAMVGAVGAPVFAGFRGGFSVLAGPTGGFIIGYIVAAFITGVVVSAAYKNTKVLFVTAGEDQADTMSQAGTLRRTILTVAGMLAGLSACYVLGLAWFMISTGSKFVPALVACVVPFLPGDAIKIIAGTLLIRKLKKHVIL